MDMALPVENVIVIEYPVATPSPPRSSVRSRLRIMATVDDPSISFSPVPTPQSATFPDLPPSFSAPPPRTPPYWLWSCHLCGLKYPLGTTRRCLNDGHYFCAGTTKSRSTGRRKIHQPCGSMFDYVGWQAYGDWRRRENKLRIRAERSCKNGASRSSIYHLESVAIEQSSPSAESLESTGTSDDSDSCSPTTTGTSKIKQNCEQNCNYPSQCRWGTKFSPVQEKKKRKVQQQDIPLPTPNSANAPDPDADEDKMVMTNPSNNRNSPQIEKTEQHQHLQTSEVSLTKRTSPTTPSPTLRNNSLFPLLSSVSRAYSWLTTNLVLPSAPALSTSLSRSPNDSHSPFPPLSLSLPLSTTTNSAPTPTLIASNITISPLLEIPNHSGSGSAVLIHGQACRPLMLQCPLPNETVESEFEKGKGKRIGWRVLCMSGHVYGLAGEMGSACEEVVIVMDRWF